MVRSSTTTPRGRRATATVAVTMMGAPWARRLAGTTPYCGVTSKIRLSSVGPGVSDLTQPVISGSSPSAHFRRREIPLKAHLFPPSPGLRCRFENQKKEKKKKGRESGKKIRREGGGFCCLLWCLIPIRFCVSAVRAWVCLLVC